MVNFDRTLDVFFNRAGVHHVDKNPRLEFDNIETLPDYLVFETGYEYRNNTLKMLITVQSFLVWDNFSIKKKTTHTLKFYFISRNYKADWEYLDKFIIYNQNIDFAKLNNSDLNSFIDEVVHKYSSISASKKIIKFYPRVLPTIPESMVFFNKNTVVRKLMEYAHALKKNNKYYT